MVHAAMAGPGRCKCCNRGSEGPPPHPALALPPGERTKVQTGDMVYTVKREGGLPADVPEKGDACVAPTIKTGTTKGGTMKADTAKGVGPQAGTTNTRGPQARTGRFRFLPLGARVRTTCGLGASRPEPPSASPARVTRSSTSGRTAQATFRLARPGEHCANLYLYSR